MERGSINGKMALCFRENFSMTKEPTRVESYLPMAKLSIVGNKRENVKNEITLRIKRENCFLLFIFCD
jgi:hypothetical protein